MQLAAAPSGPDARPRELASAVSISSASSAALGRLSVAALDPPDAAPPPAVRPRRLGNHASSTMSCRRTG